MAAFYAFLRHLCRPGECRELILYSFAFPPLIIGDSRFNVHYGLFVEDISKALTLIM